MPDPHAPTVASGPTSLPSSSLSSTSSKPSLPTLISRKESIEAQLTALGSVLDSHGVNMSTSLTTFDGYPRADIDVAQIRTTRARIIVLKNDYKDVMRGIEEAVHEAFAASSDGRNGVEGNKGGDNGGMGGEGSSLRSGMRREGGEERGGGGAGIVPARVEPPFARVNTVVAASPAERAGLKVGDKIVRFGGVDWTVEDGMARLAQVVQRNENSEILVKVLRESVERNAASRSVDLRLTPRRDWGGRGLLGCHLLPL